MATIEAMLAPKPFKGKDLDPEYLLIDFDKYVKMISPQAGWELRSR
jgi:hypothetical protein